MTIQEILQAISSAVYGRDVRNAIHDGIQKCYNDVQTFGSGVTDATNAANTAAGAANTAKTSADAAATRANTAAADAERAYQQIQTSTAIVSVNGKSGVVVLDADDVGASAVRVKFTITTGNNVTNVGGSGFNALSDIKDDMIVSDVSVDPVDAQVGDWTVNTGSGSLTVSGTVAKQATVIMTLIPQKG